MTAVWSPQPGGQLLFVTCPFREAIFTGTRGCAKTDGLLMDFAKEVGKGYGAAWRGILFRRTFPQLEDVVVRSKRWYHEIFPGAIFLDGDKKQWVWPTGERLLLRFIDNISDYWNYHGHEYPWVGFEELTTWPTLDCYHVMKSTNRSSIKGVPLRYRATTNPWGPGHNAVKAYIVDPAPAGTPIEAETRLVLEGIPKPSGAWTRVRVRGHYTENLALLAADPNYPETVVESAGGDPMIADAWLNENWDIVAGGMFDDLWRRDKHTCKPFEIPRSWRISRAFDWGSSKPFSVGWWARSDGTEATLPDGTKKTWPKGWLFRIAEWYGCKPGRPNEGLKMVDSAIARGILDREKAMGIAGRVQVGPADSSIFDEVNGDSPAKQQKLLGVAWNKADKTPGSRKRGWQILRERLKAATDSRPEGPGLTIFDTCTDFIRTVPTLSRDAAKTDDVDSDLEDHIADETRYMLLQPDRTWTTTPLRM